MDWREWKKHLTAEQWDSYVQGLIENNQDEFGVKSDGTPFFYAGPPESAQSMPLQAWDQDLKGWAEPLEWEDED